jgi:hypothetical protein
MHNYNPPNKYSHTTRMGNWSEEWELEEVKYLFSYSGAKSTSGTRTTVLLPSMKSKQNFSSLFSL